MKRIGFIYEKILDIENIKMAIKMSSLGKRDKHFVKKIMNNVDYYSIEIQKMLIDKSYVPAPYNIKTIIDGSSKKERIIHQPKYYPDQIIHWALILQIKDIFMRGMYAYTCGSIPKRGTSYGQKILRRWIDTDYSGTKYCLKMDISKFYPSIDHVLLKESMRKIIKDKDCLWLLDTIIDSNDIGIPIGNYTSQWFSNYFLQDLDHYIKEELKVKYYVRYVDDLVIVGSNKRELHKIKNKIKKYLFEKKLLLKGDWQVFHVDKRAIDFLGFRFFRNKTILRKRNALRIRRRISKIFKKDSLSSTDAMAIISYWGWIKRSNSYNFYNKNIKPKISIQHAKNVISYYAKQ